MNTEFESFGPSLAWWNGRLVARDEVRIPPDDAGFRFGDGLFETLRVDHGQADDPEAHLDRLFAGLERIDLSIPVGREMLTQAINAIAAAAPTPIARLRVTVTRGPAPRHPGSDPTRLVEVSPYQPPSEDDYRRGVPVVLLPDFRIDSRGPLAGLKSLSYQGHRRALIRAEALGAYEAILVNEHGRLCEGSRSNIALRLDGELWTPPLDEGCLPGCVRRRMVERGDLRERPLTLEDLDRADEMLLLNSLIGTLLARRIG